MGSRAVARDRARPSAVTRSAPPSLEELSLFFAQAYADHWNDDAQQEDPEIDLEFVKLEGTFSPALIDRLSTEWKIPKNLMFIGSHGEKFKYDQASLGGVRLII